jgi:hypothetical protein
MMDGGDWINLVGVVVSAGSAVWAVVSARRASAAGKRADTYRDRAETQARLATAAAEQAAIAQQQSADAAQRSADALEKQTQLAVEQAAAAEGVPWRVEHRTGAKWELWNASDYAQFKVKISGPGVTARRTPDIIECIDGHSSFEFWGNTSWGAEQRVIVTWHRREDGQDDELTWSGTMPAAG